MSFSAFALTPSANATITAAFETALGAMKTDLLGMIAIAIPVALAIVGLIFAIKKSVKFFTSLANK